MSSYREKALIDDNENDNNVHDNESDNGTQNENDDNDNDNENENENYLVTTELESPKTQDGSPLVPAVVVSEAGKSLGSADIGPKLSFVFIINQIYGPGVLAIPIVFQQSGWLLTTLFIFLFLIFSCVCSTMLAQAIASIPGNRNFSKRIEYATAVKYFYGKTTHTVFQIFLAITVQSYNVASIVVCAQSVDQAYMWMFGATGALQFSPSFCFAVFDDIDVLYSSAVLTIPAGYVTMMVLFLWQGFQNLNDNVKSVQLASFVFLIALCIEFVAYFIWQGETDAFVTVPAVGDTYTQLVSVFIFSWAYIIFVPSWLNEKKSSVSVNVTIWSAGITSFLGYVAIGLLCASAFPHINLDNMLVQLSKAPTPAVTRISAHLFALGVIAPGIPVCSVTTRYNLYVGRVCGIRMSYFFGVFAPWLVSWIFAQGEFFAQLLNWTSLIFNGLVNFVFPTLIYFTAMSRIKMRSKAIVRSSLAHGDHRHSHDHVHVETDVNEDKANNEVKPSPSSMYGDGRPTKIASPKLVAHSVGSSSDANFYSKLDDGSAAVSKDNVNLSSSSASSASRPILNVFHSRSHSNSHSHSHSHSVNSINSINSINSHSHSHDRDHNHNRHRSLSHSVASVDGYSMQCDDDSVDLSLTLPPLPRDLPVLFSCRSRMYHVPVYPWPRSLRKHARAAALFTGISISIIITVQVIVDVYFLAVKHQNVLSN